MRTAPSIFPNRHVLATEAGRFIVRSLQTAIADHGHATMVLSGGKTPRAVYEQLPSLARESNLEWKRVDVFWGDERSVPPDHPESNFLMAKESLLRHIEIPGRNIHRIMSEHPPADAAMRYAEEIGRFFGLKEGEVPSFDLLLLGLGQDGHIASIFPGSAAETEDKKLVAAVYGENMPVERITLTLPVLNRAASICMLVSGEEKAKALKAAFDEGEPVLPVHRLRPLHGTIHWFVDRDAARLLKERND